MTIKKRDLATLKDVLWEQFEKAQNRQMGYEDTNSSNTHTPTNFAVAGRTSIGALAQAIVAIEAEQRARGEVEGFVPQNRRLDIPKSSAQPGVSS